MGASWFGHIIAARSGFVHPVAAIPGKVRAGASTTPRRNGPKNARSGDCLQPRTLGGDESRGPAEFADEATKRQELAERILDIKRERNWSWAHIAKEIGGVSPVLVVGALLGQQKLVKPLARHAAELFGLSEAEERMLNEVPYRGLATPMSPTDPLLYRFYEVLMVNGPAWKALIEEEFGDGIMSAIDFDFAIEREPNPEADRVKVAMTGKFLPYKYYGSEQGIPEYGFRES